MVLNQLRNVINSSMQYVNEPHEKFLANVILMFIFWVVYYVLYITDETAMIVNKDVILNKETNKLDVFDFAWFSTLTQFGITFGDITPRSKMCKLLIIIHAILAWYIVLN